MWLNCLHFLPARKFFGDIIVGALLDKVVELGALGLAGYDFGRGVVNFPLEGCLSQKGVTCLTDNPSLKTEVKKLKRRG